MKFFIPHIDDIAAAEKLIQATTEFTTHLIPNPRIFIIEYLSYGTTIKAIVGESPDKYYGKNEPILCILENTGYK